MLSDEDGKFLLRLARDAIEKFVRNEKVEKPKNYPKILDEPRGVFCTIKKNGNLRGCIGMLYPIMPLIKATISAAISACSEDPRFRPIREAELDKIKIEISILTEPKIIEVKKPEEYLEKIKIGNDGLIIEYGPYSGLLLPQVPLEYNWNVEEFLDHLCMKAGLPEGMWKEKGIKIYKFQAQIFSE
ncbi:MAG: TIGR00296 family protein [Candidatus Aenigmatarchaeota archaeon]